MARMPDPWRKISVEIKGLRDQVADLSRRSTVTLPSIVMDVRPDLGSVPAGACYFDATLTPPRPIWSTGSAWVDATGTPV